MAPTEHFEPNKVVAAASADDERRSLRQALRAAKSRLEVAERRAAEAEWRATRADARRHQIENSTLWRIGEAIARQLVARPALTDMARRAGRLIQRMRGVAVLERAPVSDHHAGGQRPEITLSVDGAGTIVFASIPAHHASIAGASLVDGQRRTAAPRPPTTFPAPGTYDRRLCMIFFPDIVAPAVGTTLELVTAEGTRIERPLPGRVQASPRDALMGMFSRILPGLPDTLSLFHDHICPAATAFWAAEGHTPLSSDETTFGEPPWAPTVSILIPLSEPSDSLLFQLAHLSNDPSVAVATELIYVLDDPEAAAEADEAARLAHAAYGLPVRLLRPSRRCGRAAAINMAAQVAHGRLLLLLAPWVVPARKGWVDRFTETFRSLPASGILGCRHSSDESNVERVGLGFVPLAHLGAWRCTHLEPNPASTDATPQHAKHVPAVDGACLLIDREIFAAVGGMCVDYVIGGFEDADLCHRVAAAGHGVWYDPEVAMMHLRQPASDTVDDAALPRALNVYNMLLHADRWRSRLQILAPLPTGATGI